MRMDGTAADKSADLQLCNNVPNSDNKNHYLADLQLSNNLQNSDNKNIFITVCQIFDILTLL